MMEPVKMDKLDRILASEEELLPSSGLAASVMDRVRGEMDAPEPIPFPWKRVLPGMLIAAAGLIWCVVEMVRMAVAALLNFNLEHLQLPGSAMRSLASAGWVLASLGVSLVSWLLARRLIGRGGLV